MLNISFYQYLPNTSDRDSPNLQLLAHSVIILLLTILTSSLPQRPRIPLIPRMPLLIAPTRRILIKLLRIRRVPSEPIRAPPELIIRIHLVVRIVVGMIVLRCQT